MQKESAKNKKRTGIFAFTALIIFAVCFGKILLPFFICFVAVMLLRKMVKFIENVTGMNSKISGGICIAVCYILLFTFAYFFVRSFTNEIVRLAENMPLIYSTKIAPFAKRVENGVFEICGGNTELEKLLKPVFVGGESRLSDFLIEFSNNMAQSVAELVLKLPDFFLTFTVTIIASFFICIDYEKIIGFVFLQFPDHIRLKVLEIKDVFYKTIFKMFYSYFLIFILTFSQLALGFVLLKVNYSLTLSLVIAAADVLPIIGIGTILVPWAVIEFLNGNQPLAVGLVALFLIITVVRNIVEPKIIGKNIGIHPLLSLIAMYLGLKIGGVFLAVILPLVLGVLKNLNDNGVIKLYKKVGQSR